MSTIYNLNVVVVTYYTRVPDVLCKHIILSQVKYHVDWAARHAEIFRRWLSLRWAYIMIRNICDGFWYVIDIITTHNTQRSQQSINTTVLLPHNTPCLSLRTV